MDEFDLDRQNALNWVSFYYKLAKLLREDLRITEVNIILGKMQLASTGRQKALRKGIAFGVIQKGRRYATSHNFVTYKLTPYGRELLEEIENERMGETQQRK